MPCLKLFLLSKRNQVLIQVRRIQLQAKYILSFLSPGKILYAFPKKKRAEGDNYKKYNFLNREIE